MLRLAAVLALVGALAMAAPAAAQAPGDSIDALTPGRRALSFNLPNGGGVGLGIWRVVAPDRARGFFVNFSGSYGHSSYTDQVGNDNTGNSFRVSVSAGPQFRRYIGRTAPVAPFVQSGLSLGAGYDRMSGRTAGGAEQENHGWSGTAAASLAGGVEWFPLRRVSLAGQTGVNLTGGYGRSGGSVGGVGQGHSASWSVGVSTFVSSLALAIYF